MLFGQCPHGGGDKLKGASLTRSVPFEPVKESLAHYIKLSTYVNATFSHIICTYKLNFQIALHSIICELPMFNIQLSHKCNTLE